MQAARIIIGVLVVALAGWLLIHNLQKRKTADLNNRAWSLISSKDYQPALDLLEKARRRDPKNPAVHRNFGAAYEGLENVPKAIESFERSLELKPNQPEIREHVAELKKELKSE